MKASASNVSSRPEFPKKNKDALPAVFKKAQLSKRPTKEPKAAKLPSLSRSSHSSGGVGTQFQYRYKVSLNIIFFCY